MPFGLPVVPEVYSRNSGCSASNASGSWSGDAASTASCHHRSRPSVHGVSMPVRRTTTTCSTGPPSAVVSPPTASSTASLSEAALPRRYWPSVVMTIFASASSMRARSAEAEKPANTTLCMTPNRAHASIETIASGTIGM